MKENDCNYAFKRNYSGLHLTLNEYAPEVVSIRLVNRSDIPMRLKVIAKIPYIVMMTTLLVASWLIHSATELPLLFSFLGAVLTVVILVRPIMLGLATLAVLSRGFGFVETGVLARKLYLDLWDSPDILFFEVVMTLTLTAFVLIFFSYLLYGYFFPVAVILSSTGVVVSVFGLIVAFLTGDSWLRSRFS